MQTLKLVSTSLTTHFKLSAALSHETKKEMEHIFHVSYASVMRSIMYVIICIRLDISQVMGVVNRDMANFSKT